VLIGMGWIVLVSEQEKRKKRKKKKQSRRCVSPGPEKRKQEKYPGDECLLGQVVVSVVVVSL
jgi:hypothetical protein